MKKIENVLFKFCRFLDEYCPNFFTLFLFMLFGFIALLIHKYRKKDKQDIEEQKQFEKIFICKIYNFCSYSMKPINVAIEDNFLLQPTHYK